MALTKTRTESILETGVCVAFPDWLQARVMAEGYWFERSWSEDSRMQLAVDLSRWNVEQGSGGPFGAAIFESSSGRLIAVGVNRVMPDQDPTAHAEVMAIRMACQALSQFNLNQATSAGSYALYSSAEPCCMCVGAVLWSGIKQVYFAAGRAVVESTGFDEGPETPPRDLVQRGVALTHLPGIDDRFATAAAEILRNYYQSGGLIYNGG